MAQIHKDAFVLERPWTAEEFDHLAAQSSIKILSVADCFVFGRLTLDELEILTIACSPSEQRQGHAFMLMMESLLLKIFIKDMLNTNQRFRFVQTIAMSPAQALSMPYVFTSLHNALRIGFIAIAKMKPLIVQP